MQLQILGIHQHGINNLNPSPELEIFTEFIIKFCKVRYNSMNLNIGNAVYRMKRIYNELSSIICNSTC